MPGSTSSAIPAKSPDREAMMMIGGGPDQGRGAADPLGRR